MTLERILNRALGLPPSTSSMPAVRPAARPPTPPSQRRDTIPCGPPDWTPIVVDGRKRNWNQRGVR